MKKKLYVIYRDGYFYVHTREGGGWLRSWGLATTYPSRVGAERVVDAKELQPASVEVLTLGVCI